MMSNLTEFGKNSIEHDASSRNRCSGASVLKLVGMSCLGRFPLNKDELVISHTLEKFDYNIDDIHS